MIGRTDGHRVNRLAHLLEHFAIVVVLFGIGPFLRSAEQVAVIDRERGTAMQLLDVGGTMGGESGHLAGNPPRGSVSISRVRPAARIEPSPFACRTSNPGTNSTPTSIPLADLPTLPGS